MAALDRRIGWIFVGFLALLALGVARAADLGVLKAGSLQKAAVSQQITRDVIPATRGTITDRNGTQLALSEAADEIVADPFLIKHPLSVAQKLAPLLQMPVLDRASGWSASRTPATCRSPTCCRPTARRRS